MRILFLTNNPNLGSTARVLQVWAGQLAAAGYGCRVVCPRGDLADELRGNGISVLTSSLPVPNRWRPWIAGWEALRIAWWARGTTIVHCNEHTVYPFGAVVAWLLRCPIVCHVRFTLHRDFAQWAFGRFGAPSALLWTSHFQQRESAAAVAGLVPEERQQVVRLGLDTAHFGRRRQSRADARFLIGAQDESFVIGTASAIKPIKQLEDYIELVRRVRQRHPHVIGAIAGGIASGYEEYAQQLEQNAAELGDEASIRWVGHQRDIEPFLQGLDLFVSTSELETFGNSVCEAMLCGKPVVAYAGGAVAEVVGETGRIVSDKDLDGLTAQVLQLIEQREEAARLGAAGRERVRQEFDAGSRIPQLLTLYEGLLGRPIERKPLARGLQNGSPHQVATADTNGTTHRRHGEGVAAGRRPVRVLYLTNNPNRISTTVPTEGWFRHLRPRGLEPVLVSHETGAFHAWATEEGIPAYHVSLPLPSKTNPWPFFRALWRLWRLVRKHNIELIHANEQYCYPIGSYLAKLTGLPIVVSVHFTIGRDFCQWAFGKHVPHRVYFVSEGNRRACQPGIEGIVPEENQRVLNNALDLEHYRPDPAMGRQFREQHGLGSQPLLGVACVLRERKQIEHLIQAAQRLPEETQVVLAGGPMIGEEDYAAELLASSRELLGSRFHHVGHQKDLRPFCNALDLFVNTSREEAFGIASAEAMACGCPVVGYPSKAVDTVVLPGGGEMTPQDDIDALTTALSRWLGEPELVAATRISARQRVESVFDIRGVSDQLFADYRSIIGTRRSQRGAAQGAPL